MLKGLLPPDTMSPHTPDTMSPPRKMSPLTKRALTPDISRVRARQINPIPDLDQKDQKDSLLRARESKEILPDFLTSLKEKFPTLDIVREKERFEDYNRAHGRAVKDRRAALQKLLPKS